MSGFAGYVADLDELDRVLAEVAACETRLRELAADVERDTRTLQVSWEGHTAAAQEAAMTHWQAGLAAMRESLADLRTAGAAARRGYGAAAGANVEMWSAVVR